MPFGGSTRRSPDAVDRLATTELPPTTPGAEGSLEWAAPLASETFAPVAAGDVVYAVTTEGATAVSADGDRLDTVSIADPFVEAPPALGAGYLFVPTVRGVTAFE